MIRRIFWLLTLCAFLPGCSGYRLAALPGGDPAATSSAAPGAEAAETVRTGQFVRVDLNSGETVKGRVARVDGDALVLAPERDARDERAFAAGDIESLSVRKTNDAVKGTVATVVVLGAVGLLTFLVLDPAKVLSDDPR